MPTQSFAKYLRQTLVFKQSSALQKWLNFCFQGIFASAGGIFISVGVGGGGGLVLGNNSMKFSDFPDIS